MQDDQQQFDALCFLHACGKTGADEAAWMDTMIARHPHWRVQFEQERLLVAEARAAEAQRQQQALPLVSFDQVLAALAASEVPAMPKAAVPALPPLVQPISQPGPPPISQASSQLMPPPVSQPSSQPVSQPSSQPVSQPSSQPEPQPISQPSSQPAPQPISQPSALPIPQPVPPPAVQPSARQGGQGWLARVQAWWRRPVPGGLAYGALAVLVAAVSVQSWRLGQQGGPDLEAARYRGQAGAMAGAAATAQLKVVFDDRASAGAIRQALHRLGLSIVHGPDAQGAYLLSAGQGDPVQVARQLQATGLVLDALALPARAAQPPR